MARKAVPRLWKTRAGSKLSGIASPRCGCTGSGDIAKNGTVEFYSIEVIENGRKGTRRVTYEDGSIVDASFQFIQNREREIYALTSSAFPTCKTYQTVTITSEDVLAW